MNREKEIVVLDEAGGYHGLVKSHDRLGLIIKATYFVEAHIFYHVSLVVNNVGSHASVILIRNTHDISVVILLDFISNDEGAFDVILVN